MRFVPRRLAFSVFVSAMVVCAQQAKETNATQDYLLGQVKSIRTTTNRSAVQFVQPGGPTLYWPITCYDCDYEPDGTRIRQAQTVDGKALGNSSTLERDPEGHIVKRTFFDLTNGQMYHEDEFGPFGVTKQTEYRGEKGPVHGITTYDEFGHPVDAISYDSDGIESGRTHSVRTKDGTLVRESQFGPNGLLYEDSNDPNNHSERFTRYDPSGALIVKWAYEDGKYTFWESPPLPDAFGEGFYEKINDHEMTNYHCHSDSHCDLSRIHYAFQGPGRHNPTTAEWRDSSGKLLYAAYCEYTLDETGNWTHRKVWVVTPDLAERTLYEEDSRLITYWPQ
jgi:hypothetical protein